MVEAQAVYDRVSSFIEHAGVVLGGQLSCEEVTAAPADDSSVGPMAAMDDDINMSDVTAATFTVIRPGDTLLLQLADCADPETVRIEVHEALPAVRIIFDILGLDSLAEP